LDKMENNTKETDANHEINVWFITYALERIKIFTNFIFPYYSEISFNGFLS
jgi:hypothetical protein